MAESTIVAYMQAQFKTISPQKIIDLAKDALGKFLAAAHLTEPENAFKTMHGSDWRRKQPSPTSSWSRSTPTWEAFRHRDPPFLMKK